MRRRQFLAGLAGGAATSPFLARNQAQTTTSPSTSTATFLQALVKGNDEAVAKLLERQERSRGHRWFGGAKDDYGIHAAGVTAGLIKTLAAAYASPKSGHFRSSELLERLEQACTCLLAMQHPDGTIDLQTTNFHSPPDTGFLVEVLCPSLAVLNQIESPGLQPVREKLKQYLLKAGDALTVGGIHTPNHRWVVCAALARTHALFPNDRYVKRIDQWLAEGVDIDPDGQYTERSTSIYAPVCNRAFLTMARLLNREELYEPVRRNLAMTVFYLHPSGEVATEGSRRQDQYQPGMITPHYLSYRAMALKDADHLFAAVTRMIEERFGAALSGELINFLENPALKADLPPESAIPDDYAKVFSHSGLARIRRANVSATVLSLNPTILAFRRNRSVLEGVRFASAFFGKGQFRGQNLGIVSGGYRMTQELSGPYYQPIAREAARRDAAWTGVDGRAKSEVQLLKSQVTVTEEKGDFDLQIAITGTDRVPVAIELTFRKGGELRGVEPVPGVDDSYFLKSGFGEYRVDADTIRFGPGLYEHGWTQLRGAEPKLRGSSVYLTTFTPCNVRISIR